MVAIEEEAERCSGDRRQFWEHPDQLLKCQVDDGTQDRAHAEKFHCHHWYEDQGCCACTVDTMNLLVISDGVEITVEEAQVALSTMMAYLDFGERMQWGDMSMADAMHLKNKIKKTTEKLEQKLLER